MAGARADMAHMHRVSGAEDDVQANGQVFRRVLHIPHALPSGVGVAVRAWFVGLVVLHEHTEGVRG